MWNQTRLSSLARHTSVRRIQTTHITILASPPRRNHIPLQCTPIALLASSSPRHSVAETMDTRILDTWRRGHISHRSIRAGCILFLVAKLIKDPLFSLPLLIYHSTMKKWTTKPGPQKMGIGQGNYWLVGGGPIPEESSYEEAIRSTQQRAYPSICVVMSSVSIWSATWAGDIYRSARSLER